MRIRFQIEGCIGGGQKRRRIKNLNTGVLQMRFEIREGSILQDLVRLRPDRKMPALKAGLHRHGDDDEIDSAGAQLLAESSDRLDRIGLERCNVGATRHQFWFEEWWAGDVIDI